MPHNNFTINFAHFQVHQYQIYCQPYNRFQYSSRPAQIMMIHRHPTHLLIIITTSRPSVVTLTQTRIITTTTNIM